ncbi:type VII secretion target [Winogradskya humida]|uniref:type VII secretion target n=1 Tax=Winogradskya humida TaxID=113566 RepID=UPI001940530B|nr:type VII secretion target [Actinoplanes humidus]
MDEVRTHAGTVDRVAGDVETARSAVHEVSMDTGAYGQLCQFLPGLLSPLFGLALEAMNESADALQETATKLRAAADETESTDQGTAIRVRAAGSAATPAIELPL